MALLIEKGIPLPTGSSHVGGFRSEITATMAKMEIEDSVFVPDTTMNKMTAKTSEFRRRHQPTWTFRHETQTKEIDGKNISGVRIWRGPDKEQEAAE